MPDFLTISNVNEFVRFDAKMLVYVTSAGNYSDIYTCDGECRTVTLQLGMVEELMHQRFQSDEYMFVRIGKSLIVNLQFVRYINPAKRQIILSDNHSFKFLLEASKEALKQLKDYFEQNLKQQ